MIHVDRPISGHNPEYSSLQGMCALVVISTKRRPMYSDVQSVK
jgi:hypothetical protein